MKNKTKFKKVLRNARTLISSTKKISLSLLLLSGISAPLYSQTDSIKQPSWWFGVAAGANFNFYRGSTQQLNSELTTPVAFHNGFGAGLYLAPLVEFHRPDSKWGVMLQAGYDNRNGKFKEVLSPCNCPRDLSTKLSYITVEPSLRFAPLKNGFYLYAGPRVAFNIEKSFTYIQKTNPDYPEQEAEPDVKGDLSNVNSTLISMQVGAGYDIPLSSKNKQSQFVLSPFVSFQPYFGQSPRSIETWNITTVRVGAAFKFGHGKKTQASKPLLVTEEAVTPENNLPEALVVFIVDAPKNVPVERRVRETFPIRNYVFFNLGSTKIPNRYVLLKKDQVKDFKEDQLEVFKPKKLSGRSARQMVAYYNVLNILGDRMQKKPTTTIKLAGSSESGIADGKEMAESIKKYLVDVFAIEPSRIVTEGLDKPKNAAVKENSVKDLTLLQEGDRRVTIETSSPTLLMQFQSGPEAPLLPVEIDAVQQAPLDSYVTFNAQGASQAFTSWSLEVKDEKGKIQHFGPYTHDKVSLPGKSILGTQPQGDYKVTMVGTSKAGVKVRKETSVHLVLWTPSKDEQGMRFSVLFDFNKSQTADVYEKYLTEIVTPKIPTGGTVIIHGYTDIIGEESNNDNLSLARANDVKSILEKSLAANGRSDVKFEVLGLGEDEKLAQFDNKYPEQRFYNRSVVIDIIPKK
ncbi:MAG: outer membrane beta-barrel protein [Bacteroidia bacterium]|nr:outer membrane beta-barrel protein [Bacteroidia bacterium]